MKTVYVFIAQLRHKHHKNKKHKKTQTPQTPQTPQNTDAMWKNQR